MPCSGIAITTAEMRFDVERFFANNPKERDRFKAWMREKGIPVTGWFATKGETIPTAWALGVCTLYNGLAFVGNRIEIRDMETGQYLRKYKEVTDLAQAFAQVYVGQQMQAQVINACKGLNLNPRDAKVKPNGTLEFRIDLGASAPRPGLITVYKETARLEITIDGRITALTEDGPFDAGRTKLEMLLAVLKGQGINLAPSGKYETHRHDKDKVRAAAIRRLTQTGR